MSLFNTRTFTIKRPSGPGKYVRGIWVPGSDGTPITATGTIQPLNGKETEAFLEGRRVFAAFTIFTETPVAQTDPKTKTQGDTITLDDGYDYEVFRCKPWQNQILNHYEVVVYRIKEGETP